VCEGRSCCDDPVRVWGEIFNTPSCPRIHVASVWTWTWSFHSYPACGWLMMLGQSSWDALSSVVNLWCRVGLVVMTWVVTCIHVFPIVRRSHEDWPWDRCLLVMSSIVICHLFIVRDWMNVGCSLFNIVSEMRWFDLDTLTSLALHPATLLPPVVGQVRCSLALYCVHQY
jgi:hypothetical protein